MPALLESGVARTGTSSEEGIPYDDSISSGSQPSRFLHYSSLIEASHSRQWALDPCAAGCCSAGVILRAFEIAILRRAKCCKFYKKYIDEGLPVAASADVADAALQRTYEIVTHAGRSTDVLRHGRQRHASDRNRQGSGLHRHAGVSRHPNPAYQNEPRAARADSTSPASVRKTC